MFCPNCGKGCQNAKFCPECGQDLRSISSEQSFEERKQKLRAEGQAYCPKCLSTSIVIREQQNQYIHSPFAGLFWMIRDYMISRHEKTYGLEYVCMKCDYRWYSKQQAMREKYVAYLSQNLEEPPTVKLQLTEDMYLILDEIGVTIGCTGRDEYLVPYEDLVAVEFRESLGPLDGRLSIRDRANKRRKFPKTFAAAKKDKLTLFYHPLNTKRMRRIYFALQTIIKENKNAGMF